MIYKHTVDFSILTLYQHLKNWWHLVPSLQGKHVGKKWIQWQILFSWAQKSLRTVTAAMKLKDACYVGKKPRQHIKKQDITLLTKIKKKKSLVFPVVMYGYESGTIKKAECQRSDAFKLWSWRRFYRESFGQQDQTKFNPDEN